MTSYLREVRRIWDHIAGEDDNIRLHLDASTIESLQGLCLWTRQDREFVENKRGEMFPMIQKPEQRRQIWARLFTIPTTIPSLHTFLEDTKYLEPCAKAMKLLLSSKIDRTIRWSFQASHNGQHQLKLQLTENEYEEQHQDCCSTAEWLGYRQLWLYVMRHFPEMTGHAPRQDFPRSKASTTKEELIWWCRFYDLARTSGYTEVSARVPTTSEADLQMSESFLRRVRPLRLYDFPVAEFDMTVRKLVELIEHVKPKDASIDRVDGPTACPTEIIYRCGVPFEKSMHEDRGELFLTKIYSTTQQREHVTSFDVKRDMFHRFFGTPVGDPLALDSRSGEDIEIQVEENETTSGIPENTLVDEASPTQIVSETTVGERLDFPASPISELEALRLFRRYSWQRNSTEMIIISHTNHDQYDVMVCAMDDTKAIKMHLTLANTRRNVSYVIDSCDSANCKITNLHDILARRYPCVIRIPPDSVLLP